MRIAVMQPYIFPYIGYFHLMHAVEKFVIYDDVNYINRGWINRNRILLNGKEYLFTVPIKKASQNNLICETEISDEYKVWKKKFLKTISVTYSKAPYYSDTKDIIENILKHEGRNLLDFIERSLKILCEYFYLKCTFQRSSKINNHNLRSEERIIDILNTLSANEYVNAPGGIRLYSKENFKKNGLKLYFIKSHEVEYKQYGNKFIPWLSIIDVMMFNSIEEIRRLIAMYEIVE